MTTPSTTDTENQKTESTVSPEAVTSDAGHPSIRVPVEARGLALGILATVASVWALRGAQDFFVSLLVGILFAYTLNPLVVWLERVKVPRVVGTSVVMASVLCALVFGAFSLRGQVQAIVNQLPAATNKLSEVIADLQHSQRRNMQKVQNAARAIENATKPVVAPSNPEDAPTHVVVEPPAFKLSSLLWAGSIGALGFLGQTAMVIFLVFFLLLAGDTFKRKLVRIAGPSLSKKKITIQILDDINRSIQRYMLMLLTTNILVGGLSWIAFRWIGLDNAGAWAVAAGVFHLIPYFGPAVMAAVTGVAAFMQFNSFSSGVLVAAASLLVATVVGTFVTTWMTGRIAKMNT
ncbi:MAG: AI-2E family transporter, partial [Burkholderiales bacterium]